MTDPLARVEAAPSRGDADPSRTYALVVGIEKYQVAGWADLDGPASDAVRFIRWLLERQVPPAQILAFISPLEKNRGVLADLPVTVNPATEQFVEHALDEGLPGKRGDLLFVFWGGHGVSDATHGRYLFYADATSNKKRHLRIDQQLQALQTSRYDGLRRQICIIDACANFLEELNFDSTVVSPPVSMGRPSAPDQQFVLFAARRGQTAKNFSAEQTGALSREVLKALATERRLPPDIAKVARTVRARFVDLRRDGKLRQVPEFCQFVNWDGEEEVITHGQPRRRNLSSEQAARMCNRSNQEDDFVAHFTTGVRAHPALHTYVIYGERGEAHASFYQRLLDTCIRERATAKWDMAGGVARIHPAIQWPGVGGDQLKFGQRRLIQRLADAADGIDSPIDSLKDWRVLLETPRFQNYPLVVIPHEISLESWGPRDSQLLRWYLSEWWAQAPESSAARAPTVVLVLLVVCAEKMVSRSVADWLRLRGSSMTRLQRDLAALGVEGRPDYRRIILGELPPLEYRDIEAWFNVELGHIGSKTSYDRCEAAKNVLRHAERRRDNIPRTDHIEKLLREEHAKWLTESAFSK